MTKLLTKGGISNVSSPSSIDIIEPSCELDFGKHCSAGAACSLKAQVTLIVIKFACRKLKHPATSVEFLHPSPKVKPMNHIVE